MSEQVHYSDMKSTKEKWLGDIPASWGALRLKRMFSIKKDIAGEEGHTVLSVTQKGIRPKVMTEKGQFAQDYSKYQLVTQGEFVMNHMDLLTGWVDISAYDGVTSPDYRVFVNSDPRKYDSGYYRYIFQLCYSARIFYGLGQGVAGFGRWRLPADMFLNFVLPVPSMEEQIRISAYLDDQISQIDSIIDEAKGSIEEYEQWKASTIFEAVTKGIDNNMPLKHTSMPFIPIMPLHWGRSKVGRFSIIYNGDRTSRYPKPDEFVDEGIPFLNSSNINGDIVDTSVCKYITKEKYNSLSGAKLQIGDIVYCLRGSIGKCALNSHLSEGTVASSLATIRPTGIDGKYLLYCLLSKVAQEQAQLFMNGTCAANLSAESVSNFYIPVPPAEEQRTIGKYCYEHASRFDELISEKQSLIEDMEQYKRSLIYEAVTGKRKVV